MKKTDSNKRKNKTKSNKKYVTTNDGGIDFRSMSKIMTNAGYPQNHATIRNNLCFAIEELLFNVSKSLKIKMRKSVIKQLITSQFMQDNLSDVIYSAYKELLQEEIDAKTGVTTESIL